MDGWTDGLNFVDLWMAAWFHMHGSITGRCWAGGAGSGGGCAWRLRGSRRVAAHAVQWFNGERRYGTNERFVVVVKGDERI